MLTELIEKLALEHGIPADKASGILNTIVQHVKEKFPQVGGMLDSALGTQMPTSPTGATPATEGNESMLGKLEDLAKSKLGGIFGGG